LYFEVWIIENDTLDQINIMWLSVYPTAMVFFRVTPKNQDWFCVKIKVPNIDSLLYQKRCCWVESQNIFTASKGDVWGQTLKKIKTHIIVISILLLSELKIPKIQINSLLNEKLK